VWKGVLGKGDVVKVKVKSSQGLLAYLNYI
jgi:hypothetical protein